MFVFDFEVFMHDWLVVFKDVYSGEYTKIVNNAEELKTFYGKNKKKIFFGYNNKSFDNIIFNAILSDVDPYSTMILLFSGVNIFEIYKSLDIKWFPIATFDLMQDILGMSLKEAEGFMGMSIEESTVDFNLDRKLTDEELSDVLSYCIHDVDATAEFMNHRQGYIMNKMNVCKLFNLPLTSLNKTNASLAGTILNAKKQEHYDEFSYDLPKEVIIRNPKYKKILNLYVGKPLVYKDKLKIDIAGIPHILAYGGIHGARENFQYKGELWQLDAASYYPTLMIEYGYVSRNVKNPDDFKKLYYDRMEAKKNGDRAKSDALKLTLNTSYGAMKSELNPLYDPKMANQVCITGQLLFVDLIEKLEPYCKLVQSNTDGVLIIPYDKEKIDEVCEEWVKRTRVPLEKDIYKGIWQKDVNNYIILDEKDIVTTKGGYVSQYQEYNPNRTRVFKNSARVIDVAICEYFINNIPPRDYIMRNNNINDFQIITKTGNTFKETYWEHKNGPILVNKVNRVFATKHTGYGKVYKVKEVDGEDRRHNIASLPDHCYIDNEGIMDLKYVDKSWYIETAKKRLDDFKGRKK